MCHNITFTSYQQYSMVRCPLTEDQFFNHDRAKQWITDDLKRPPHICLYTGPQNSGKTTLLRRCLQDFKVHEQPANVCVLDLRKFSFIAEAEFEESVLVKLSIWQDSILDSYNKLPASVNLEKLVVPASSMNLNQTPLADGKKYSR